MLRILHIIGSMNCGGAENFIMNVYRKLDTNNIQFDFVIHTGEHCFFEDEIRARGGRIYRTQKYVIQNHLYYAQWWERFFREHPEYQVVHGHINSSAAIYLQQAKRQGRYTIVHSHTSESGGGIKGLVKDAIQLPIRKYADVFLACSREAACWLYGKKIGGSDKSIVVKNGIDTEKYRCDQTLRAQLRAQNGIAERVVIGHAGRLIPSKNQGFLLEMMEHLLRQRQDIQLWLFGEGPTKAQLQELVQRKGLDDYVVFAGVTHELERYFQQLDVFVFPSLYEGLPLAVLEAQAAGLPCLISEAVVPEVDVGAGLITRMSLQKTPAVWAECAMQLSQKKHIDAVDYVRSAGYDIMNTVQMLLSVYENAV